MTVALKKILKDIEKMSEQEQDAIANLLKEEITWQKSFDDSQDILKMLAEEAKTEYSKGKTKPMKL